MSWKSIFKVPNLTEFLKTFKEKRKDLFHSIEIGLKIYDAFSDKNDLVLLL